MKLKFLGATFLTLVFVFWPLTVAQADSPGLTVEVYTYDPSALPDRQPYTLCETATVWTSAANINTDFDAEFGGIVGGCQGDFVLMHYSGFITAPVSADVVFQSRADDGFYLSLDDVTVIDNWTLKGCGGGQGVFPMSAGQSYKLDSWFYEFGGGACNELYWDLGNGSGMVAIPDSAFTNVPQVVVVPDPPVVEPPIVIPDPEPTKLPPVVIPDPEPPVVIPDPPVVPDPKPPVIVVPPIVIPPVAVPDPPVIPDPPVVTPQNTLTDLTSVAPTDLTDAQVTQLQQVAYQVLESVPENSPEYAQALDALYVAAQADDIQVDASIASIPGVGAVAVGLTNAINLLGNIGSDMSPAHRATAKKEVVAAVVVTQIAVGASGMATQASIASSGGAVRKRN
jgi:hypothetical protein